MVSFAEIMSEELAEHIQQVSYSISIHTYNLSPHKLFSETFTYNYFSTDLTFNFLYIDFLSRKFSSAF